MQEEKDGIFDVLHILTRRHMLEAVSHSKNTCSLVSMVALHVVQAMEGISIPRRGRKKLKPSGIGMKRRETENESSFEIFHDQESRALLKETCPIFEINLSRAPMLRLLIFDRFQFQSNE
ncbi:hypothetical protein Tco_0808732 [Tanacetum coccineum]